jgi:hypothetical protein
MPLVSLVTVTVEVVLNKYTQCLLASSKSTTYEGMKVKFSGNISMLRKTACHPCAGCQIGHISKILGTVLCLKLKLTILVVGVVELTKRLYLDHNTNAFTPTTTATFTITATKTKTTTINCSPTATIILTGHNLKP